jgi:hypothetical protein
MMTDDRKLADFVGLCALLTGFSAHELRGTGNATLHLATLSDMAGPDHAEALLDAYARLPKDDAARALRQAILSDGRLGPLARNLIRLWYSGVWKQLPRDWHETHGGPAADRDFIPAPNAYVEGLLWPAVGANPPGAKPFGYGMWAFPPRVQPE